MEELKKKIKPEFEANPDKYYPTKTLRDTLGFTRLKCSKSGKYFWALDATKTHCGDSG
jgi:alanyl-tRNA synthetase